MIIAFILWLMFASFVGGFHFRKWAVNKWGEDLEGRQNG